VHLLDILAFRSGPAAGLFLSLTRRCPLHCGHCSTRSTMHAEQYDEAPFVRLVASFTPQVRPDVLWLTGGEPLLRPRLVERLAERAREAGTTTALLSGMWFAESGPSPSVARGLRAVDHVSASIDRFHEIEVPRQAVLRQLSGLLDEGRDVSVHLVVDGPDDPYFHDAVRDIRTTLDDGCPIHVSLLAPVGRGVDRARSSLASASSDPQPCELASWPVVVYDGTVIACCSQLAVDGPIPEHLRLGHAAVDGWDVIRERALTRPMVRALRTYGPGWIADRYGSGGCDGYCETCLSLSDDPGVAARVEAHMQRPGIDTLEQRAAALAPTAVRWVAPPFAELLELGRAVPA
jgi:pyruvate-formate lyase-activating enzyme